MKILKNNKTILYTHNTIELKNQTSNKRLLNLLGSRTTTRYQGHIVWVPENSHSLSPRTINVIPQYKFGLASSPEPWVDDFTQSWNLNSETSFESRFSSLNNYTNYTNNIAITTTLTFNNNNINILNNFSNYSDILSLNETSLTYYISLRFKLELLNSSFEIEDVVTTYITEYICGRSSACNIGDFPLLLWDKDEEGNQLPPLEKDFAVLTAVLPPIQNNNNPGDSDSSPTSPGGNGLSLNFNTIE